MATLNRVQLIGRLGQNPEVKYLPSGTTVANFSVATTETKRDEGERTEWHNLVAFGKLAEVCGEYLRKGSLVYVEGTLRTQKWDKDGQKHSRTEVVANNIQFLDRKTRSDDAENQSDEEVPF